MCETRENGELWVFLKFQKSPLIVFLAYETSCSVFKSPGGSGAFYR